VAVIYLILLNIEVINGFAIPVSYRIQGGDQERILAKQEL
jgi:hypothetical protein